jgi:hypothetical protein
MHQAPINTRKQHRSFIKRKFMLPTKFNPNFCYENLNNVSTMNLLQTNNSILIGGRIIQHLNGEIEIIPKSPAFIFGEVIVRPTIDASIALCKHVWSTISWGFASLDNVCTRIFNFIPGAQAKLIPDIQKEEIQTNFDSARTVKESSANKVIELEQQVTCAIRNETCPLMSTWINFIDLMCKNGGGGITITPMRSHHMNPQSGIVVALKGFSKIVPALEFCSSGQIIIEQYVEKNSDLLSESILSDAKKIYEPYLGAWYNSDNEKVYLDISVVFNEEDSDKAIAFAKEQDQIAAYHITEGREIPTGGTGEN